MGLRLLTAEDAKDAEVKTGFVLCVLGVLCGEA
jgi:hypothetical protein